MSTRRASFAATALVALAAAGCAVGPDYERPDVAPPEQFAAASPEMIDSTATLADVPWFEVFSDTLLQSLVREAIANNLDLRIAAARVEQSRAVAGIVGSQLFPAVGISANASRGRTSEDVAVLPDGQTNNSFDLGGALSWEIDLFGRIRREKEAAKADALAAEYDQRGVVIALVAEVATQYFNLRELDARLDIARRTYGTRQGTLEMFTRRFEGGIASALETSQAEADLRDTAARIPDLERLIAIQENALSILVGRNPGAVIRAPIAPARFDSLAVPAGIPSLLLERRPDVRAAEERLHAANARVGAAFAQYFPTISLTGFFGGASRDLEDLLSSDNNTWSVGGGLLQPVFEGGRIRATHRAAKAEWEAAQAQYLLVARQAFGDVADALVSVEKIRLTAAEYEKRVAALETGARLSKLRYEGGLASYLEVLDADRQLFAGANDLASSRGDLARAYVQIYRSLGGGWNADQPAAE